MVDDLEAIVAELKSEAKEANRRLALFEGLFQKSNVGIRIYELREDNKLWLVETNPTSADIGQKKPEEMIGKSFEELFENQRDLLDMYMQVLKTGEAMEVEYQYKGNIIKKGWYRVRAFPINEKHLSVVFQDISERKKVEEELRQSTTRFQQIAETAPVLIWEVAPDGMYTYCNQMIKNYLGLEPDDVVSKKYFYDFFLPDEKEGLKVAAFEAFKDRKSIVNFINRNLKADGNIVVLSTNGVPIIDRDGNFQGYRGVDVDITQLVEAEHERIRHQRMESASILAGGVAHDLNNMMAGLVGYLDIIGIGIIEDQPGILASAHAITERITGLTGRLLTLSKGDSPVKSLESLFEIIHESTQITLVGSNCKASYEMPDTEPWKAEVDKGQIGQIIQNLVINARQAMPDGGNIYITSKNTTIKERQHEHLLPGDYVMISVKDEGTGMPKERIEKIFEPYFTTKRSEGGSGLGLAVVYSIIKGHHGYVEIESKEGEGTTFNIYLPASKQIEKESSEIKSTNIQGKGERILIIDDQLAIVRVMDAMLKHLGYRPECTKDPEEAIMMYENSIAERDKYRLVFLDYTIPGKIGSSLILEGIRQIDPDANVSMMSGNHKIDEIVNPEKYRLKPGLSKPFRMEVLGEVVKKALE